MISASALGRRHLRLISLCQTGQHFVAAAWVTWAWVQLVLWCLCADYAACRMQVLRGHGGFYPDFKGKLRRQGRSLSQSRHFFREPISVQSGMLSSSWGPRKKGTAISSVKCMPGRASGSLENQPQVTSSSPGDSLPSKHVNGAGPGFLPLVERKLGFGWLWTGCSFYSSLAFSWIGISVLAPTYHFIVEVCNWLIVLQGITNWSGCLEFQMRLWTFEWRWLWSAVNAFLHLRW